MSVTISFHQLAELELKEAALYYNSEVPGLGNTFLGEVEHTLDQITQYPSSAPPVLGVVRRKLVRRFPYSVLYSFENDTVRILAIANQKRRPFYWRLRR